MKTGLSLTELAAKLQAQKEAAKDYNAPAKSFKMGEDGKLEIAIGEGAKSFPLTDHAHGQLAQDLSIPKAYYDRMRENAPDLLTSSVNRWLGQNEQSKFIRTMNGNVRAILSNRYRPFDNFDVAEQSLNAILSANCNVESCEVTDKRFYLKVVSPRVSYEITKGDVVQAGLVISNSEIGAGSLKVEPLIYRLVCTNGMIAAESAFRRNHAGKALMSKMDSLGDQALEFMSDETRRLSDLAVLAQIKDLVNAILSDSGFAKIASKMAESKQDRIEQDPFKAVEVFGKQFAVSENNQKGILAHLLKDGDLSRYGLLNAVTRYAQDVEDYDTATDFERMGGQVLELSRSSWKEISQAPAH